MKEKTTSLENWLKDENLDRQAGIKPTHPGHTVDTNPRWSGVGKGDSSRVSDVAAFDVRRNEVFGQKRKRRHVVRSYKKNGKWLHDVATKDGVIPMTDQEHDTYEQGL